MRGTDNSDREPNKKREPATEVTATQLIADVKQQEMRDEIQN